MTYMVLDFGIPLTKVRPSRYSRRNLLKKTTIRSNITTKQIPTVIRFFCMLIFSSESMRPNLT